MNTLFDTLNTHALTAEAQLDESIRGHLQVLLNSRQGSITHMPDYGLPDLSELYAELPDSLTSFSAAVAACIQRYEPRLNHVTVRPHPDAEKDTVMDFIIEGRILNRQQHHFLTEFSSDGWARVSAG